MCPNTTEPVWDERHELQLRGREIGIDGLLCNDEAQYSRLRIEVWDRDPCSRDVFLGEISIPLTPLMDLSVHRFTLPLSDPEGSLETPVEEGASGRLTFEVSLEA